MSKRAYAELLRRHNNLMRENNKKEKAIKKQSADCYTFGSILKFRQNITRPTETYSIF